MGGLVKVRRGEVEVGKGLFDVWSFCADCSNSEYSNDEYVGLFLCWQEHWCFYKHSLIMKRIPFWRRGCDIANRARSANNNVQTFYKQLSSHRFFIPYHNIIVQPLHIPTNIHSRPWGEEIRKGVRKTNQQGNCPVGTKEKGIYQAKFALIHAPFVIPPTQ